MTVQPVRAYAYVRYSSKKQEKGDSLERQRDACLAYVASKGWELAEEFGDLGVSAWKGDHLKKGRLGKFAERVQAGAIPPGSVLVIENLDRLSRLHPRITQRWMEDMTDLGLRIAVVNGDRIYDQDTLGRSLFETFEILMKAHAAHEYVNRLSGLLSSSWETRRKAAAAGKVVSKSGSRIISAHVPGWLTVVGEGAEREVKPIPEREELVREIYQMAADGIGARSIARILNERPVKPWGREYHHRKSAKVGWEHTYIRDILRSAAVEGDYEPGIGRRTNAAKTGERFVGYFGKPIVDADLVRRARVAMASRRGTGGRGKGSEKLTNLFAGLALCGACGGKMTLVGNSKKPQRYLMCMDAIFTCREDRMAWLHFDTRQFAHIVWKTHDDLREQLYNRIAATLKEAPGAPGRGGGFVDPPPEQV